MLAFTNNSGPLFIIGTVGILLFGNTSIGILLFITHLLSSITVGLILGICSKIYKADEIKHELSLKNQEHLANSLSNLGNILGSSIYNAISTVMLIGGFVVLFSVILAILNRLNLISLLSNTFSIFGIPFNFSKGLISGIIELTNGVNIVSSIHIKAISTNIILCAFLLGFGGFSVLLQVLSIISKEKLSIKTYTLGKLLQGFFASLYTILFIKNCFIFNIDIPNQISHENNILYYGLIIALIFVIIFALLANQKKNIIHKV